MEESTEYNRDFDIHPSNIQLVGRITSSTSPKSDTRTIKSSPHAERDTGSVRSNPSLSGVRHRVEIEEVEDEMSSDNGLEML